MKKVAMGCLVALGGLIAILILIPIVVIATSGPERNSVLSLDISGEIMEFQPDDLISQFTRSQSATVRDYLDAIEKAKHDPKINGIFAKIGWFSFGFATTQEFWDKIQDFRASGKWAVAYMETAGEFYSGARPYYLATAFDEIYLSPPGTLHLVGVRAEVPFIRGTLDKLRIYPDVDHIGKYKSAKNYYTETGFTEAHRESTESWVDSIYRQLVKGIAEGREMTEEEVAEKIDKGPFISQEALSEGFVDDLLYYDQARDRVEEKNGGTLPLIKIRQYLKRNRPGSRGSQRIALIYGVGAVVRGEGGYDPISHESYMGSDAIARALRQAREDSGIRAIVLRVNSPGGSYIASDVIHREAALAADEKPFVVSMSDLAASGGYFISMPADRIIAHPATLTASIGIVAGKMNTRGFYDMIGITKGIVSRGDHSGFYSSYQNYTDGEREVFQQQLHRIYEDFITKVAENRDMGIEEVDRIARGRVYTGEQAMDFGLIDEFGGLDDAILRAKELAGIEPDEKVRIEVFPPRKTFLQSRLSRDLGLPRSIAVLGKLLRSLPPELLYEPDPVEMRIPYRLTVE
ncbi:MAG: signal peptide peptidase SppA [Acidobacteriota bacterium]